MLALQCNALGDESTLRIEDIEPPTCSGKQVLVDVKAASLNFPDALMIRGMYQMKPELPFSPGSELAGEVIAVGDDQTNYVPGDRVLCLSGYGALRQQIAIDPQWQQIHRLPNEMPWEDAASFNMTYGTSMNALHQRGQVKAGETVLVIGATGGCGSAAIHIAKAMGATVIALAGSEEKCAQAKALGADHVVSYTQDNFSKAVKEITHGKGVDVIYDPVGGDDFREYLRCAAWNGRYLVIGFAGGDIPQLPLNHTILKCISVIGVAYGMSAIQDPATNNDNFAQLFDWYAQGLLKPFIGSRRPFVEAADAIADMYARRIIGKTVIAF